MSKADIPAPRWTNAAVIEAARRLSKEFERLVGREFIQHNGQRFEHVYAKFLHPKFRIELTEGHDLGHDESGRKILGLYKIHENLALIDATLAESVQDPRRVFTLYHEVAGHGALQGKWLQRHLRQLEVLEVTEISVGPDAERRLERQANLFAAHFAAPDWLIDFAIVKVFRPGRRFVYTGPCEYCLTTRNGLSLRRHVTDLLDLAGLIGSKINQFFGGLSGEALGYRIVERGWIINRGGARNSRGRGRLFRVQDRRA